MVDVTWRKVWRDLARNKARTALVVLATTVGVFALGMAFGLSELLRERMRESHQAVEMAHIRFWTSPFDESVLEEIARDPEIIDVEGVVLGAFRWRLEGETDWREGDLIARVDYNDQRMNRVELLAGSWPKGRVLAVERLSSQFYSVDPGAIIEVDFGQRVRSLPVDSVIRGRIILPPKFGDRATFFATPETIAWLTGQTEDFNELHVRLKSFSQEGAEDAAMRIGRRLESLGLTRTDEGYHITNPEVHWAQEQVDTILFIMSVLGVLSLGLSGFLIINTMNSIVVQQVWQMGVMKVIGGTFWRVARIYLATALVYAVMALLLAVPLGTFAAFAIAREGLNNFNIPVDSLQVMPKALAIQVGVGLAVPLLAALVPVIGGVRTTAREAIDTRGLGADFGQGWLDQLVGRIRRLPRPLMLSLRNTFRRKARIALTLTTLVLGGVMFIVVISVQASMNNTFQVLLHDFGHDVMARFDQPHRVGRLVEVAESVEGVEGAEVWGGAWASLSLPDGGVSEAYLWGVPRDSEMFSPRIVAGRNLLPDDTRAILLNSKIADDEGIRVGDEVELTIGERESAWTVVGLAVNISNGQRENFVPLGALARETDGVNKGTVAMVRTDHHDFETQQRVSRSLDDAFASHHIEPTSVEGAIEVRDRNQSQFEFAVYLMVAMAALAAAVGSLGLASTMSINVIERAREIGVMRAIGATSLAVVTIFVGEGVFVGALSWLLAVPLSYPSALIFGNVVGDTLIRVPLEFSYSVGGAFLWLTTVVVLSALASLWPALRAARISVREALAYE